MVKTIIISQLTTRTVTRKWPGWHWSNKKLHIIHCRLYIKTVTCRWNWSTKKLPYTLNRIIHYIQYINTKVLIWFQQFIIYKARLFKGILQQS